MFLTDVCFILNSICRVHKEQQSNNKEKNLMLVQFVSFFFNIWLCPLSKLTHLSLLLLFGKMMWLLEGNSEIFKARPLAIFKLDENVHQFSMCFQDLGYAVETCGRAKSGWKLLTAKTLDSQLLESTSVRGAIRAEKQTKFQVGEKLI